MTSINVSKLRKKDSGISGEYVTKGEICFLRASADQQRKLKVTLSVAKFGHSRGHPQLLDTTPSKPLAYSSGSNIAMAKGVPKPDPKRVQPADITDRLAI